MDGQRNYHNHTGQGLPQAQYHLPLPIVFPPPTFAQPNFSPPPPYILPFQVPPIALNYQAPIGLPLQAPSIGLNYHYHLHIETQNSLPFPTPSLPLFGQNSLQFPTPSLPLFGPGPGEFFQAVPLSSPSEQHTICSHTVNSHPRQQPSSSVQCPPLSLAMRKEWKMETKRNNKEWNMETKRNRREAKAEKRYYPLERQKEKAKEKKRLRNKKKRAAEREAQARDGFANAGSRHGFANAGSRACDLNLLPSSAEDATEDATSMLKGPYERIEHNLAEVDRYATERLRPEIGPQDKELQEPMMGSPSSTLMENHDPQKENLQIRSLLKQWLKLVKEGNCKAF